MYEVNIIDVNTNLRMCINEIDTSTNNRLEDATIKETINSINSFQFNIYPQNIGYEYIKEFTTLIEIINIVTNEVEYKGRVLSITPSMENDGVILKQVVCESDLAYTKDSDQDYEIIEDTADNIFKKIVNMHNDKVEEYKRFIIGSIQFNQKIEFTIKDSVTYENIMNLIDKLEAEIIIRYENNLTYIDLLPKISEKGNNTIEISENMESVSYDKDVSGIITKLKVLGSKTKDLSGKTTEKRIDISSKNSGSKYLIDEEAKKIYGIITGIKSFDNITDIDDLIQKGKEFLTSNNKIIKKIKLNCLDLFYIGLTPEKFNLRKEYRIVNALINLNDFYRLVSKTININSPQDVTLEFGEVKSDIKFEQVNMIKKINSINKTIEEVNDETKNELIDINNSISDISNKYLSTIDYNKDMKKINEKIIGNIHIVNELENEEDLKNIETLSIGDIYIIGKDKYIYTGIGFLKVPVFLDYYTKDEIDKKLNELKGGR